MWRLLWSRLHGDSPSGGIFSSILGGFRADGGSVVLGQSYIVGERGAERFVPTRPGQIVPNHALTAGSKQPIVNNIHFNGVQDMDSFRASQDHILGYLGNAVGRAISRR